MPISDRRGRRSRRGSRARCAGSGRVPARRADDERRRRRRSTTSGVLRSAFSAIRPCASVKREDERAAADREQSAGTCRGCRGRTSSPNSSLADRVADRAWPPTTPIDARRRPRSARAAACRCGSRRACPRSRAAASFGSSAACTAWNTRSGMRAMKMPGDEVADEVLLAAVVASRSTPSTPAYESSWRAPNRRAGSRARSTAPSTARSGPGCTGRAARAARSSTATIGGSAEGERRTGRATVDADDRTSTITERRCATMPSEPCIRPYGPKRPLPESVPRVMKRDVVDRRCAMNRPTNSSASPLNSSVDDRRGRRRCRPTTATRREDAAERRGALHERAAADALRAPVRRARGRPLARAAGRSPGATTNTIAHSTLMRRVVDLVVSS